MCFSSSKYMWFNWFSSLKAWCLLTIQCSTSSSECGSLPVKIGSVPHAPFTPVVFKFFASSSQTIASRHPTYSSNSRLATESVGTLLALGFLPLIRVRVESVECSFFGICCVIRASVIGLCVVALRLNDKYSSSNALNGMQSPLVKSISRKSVNVPSFRIS